MVFEGDDGGDHGVVSRVEVSGGYLSEVVSDAFDFTLAGVLGDVGDGVGESSD